MDHSRPAARSPRGGRRAIGQQVIDRRGSRRVIDPTTSNVCRAEARRRRRVERRTPKESPLGSRRAIDRPTVSASPPGSRRGIDRPVTGRPGCRKVIDRQVIDRRGSRKAMARRRPAARSRPGSRGAIDRPVIGRPGSPRVTRAERLPRRSREAKAGARTGGANDLGEMPRRGQVVLGLRLRRRLARGAPANCRRLTASARRAMSSGADRVGASRR